MEQVNTMHDQMENIKEIETTRVKLNAKNKKCNEKDKSL